MAMPTQKWSRLCYRVGLGLLILTTLASLITVSIMIPPPTWLLFLLIVACVVAMSLPIIWPLFQKETPPSGRHFLGKSLFHVALPCLLITLCLAGVAVALWGTPVGWGMAGILTLGSLACLGLALVMGAKVLNSFIKQEVIESDVPLETGQEARLLTGLEQVAPSPPTWLARSVNWITQPIQPITGNDALSTLLCRCVA